MTLQFRATCRIKETQANSEMLIFEFNLGPIFITCLANVPREGEDTSVAFVKLELRHSRAEWEITEAREHTKNSKG